MFLDLAGARVCYEAAGDGPPVLLLHGWGANAAAMRPIFDALRPDHTVYALDFPGFGQSGLPPAPWGVGEYAALVIAFLDSLGVGRTDVVGHSFGGRVGIRLAAKWPERVQRLVLVDSAGVRPAQTPGRATLRAGLRVGRSILSAPGLDALRGKAEALARDRLGSEDYRVGRPSARDVRQGRRGGPPPRPAADPGSDVTHLGRERPGHAARRREGDGVEHPRRRTRRPIGRRSLLLPGPTGRLRPDRPALPGLIE